MAMQKRKALRAMCVFLCVMAAITFSSRTLYNATLPKVQVVSVHSGVLTHTYASSEFIIDGDEIIRVSIPVRLDNSSLKVERVHVSMHCVFEKNDALLSFDPVLGEAALNIAEDVLMRAEEELRMWDIRYQSALDALDLEITRMQYAVRGNNAEISAAAQLNLLRREREIMSSEYIVDGDARSARERTHADAEAIRNTLLALKNNDWTVFAPERGLVCEIFTEVGAMYGGAESLLRYIPENVNLLVGITYDVRDVPIISEKVVVYTGDTIPRGGTSSWRYYGHNIREGNRIIWAQYSDGDLPDLSITRLNFRVESERYSCLVPNSAVINDAVYVLGSRQTAWGMQEQYVRRIPVQGVIRDDRNTYVPTGITGQDSIIVRWDRPLADGDAVITTTIGW